MGIMITYGSYMKKDVSIESAVHQIEIFDTGIAFLAGLMIVPAVFVFSGGDASVLGAGPSLMFITLPKVFETMGVSGQIVGSVFFVLVLLAALTSSISLMETVVSIIHDKFKLSRKMSCLLVIVLCIVLGLPSALGYGLLDSVKIFGFAFLDFFDFISNSILMPIVALLTCFVITFIIDRKTIIEEVEISGKFKSKGLFNVVIKYIAPVFLLAILVSAMLDTLGIVKI